MRTPKRKFRPLSELNANPSTRVRELAIMLLSALASQEKHLPLANMMRDLWDVDFYTMYEGNKPLRTVHMKAGDLALQAWHAIYMLSGIHSPLLYGEAEALLRDGWEAGDGVHVKTTEEMLEGAL